MAKAKVKSREVPLKSLDNALLLLDELAAEAPISLSALARRTELTVPTAHRILATFAARGHAVLDHETQMWSLGAQSHFIGARYLQPEGFSLMAKSILSALASDTGETAVLGVLDRKGVLIVDQCAGGEALSVRFPTGTILPAATSAHGRALLSSASKATRKRHHITETADKPSIAIEIESIAIDHGKMDKTLCGTAAIVTDTFNKSVAAIGIYGPMTRFDQISDCRINDLVHRSATTLSITLSGMRLRAATASSIS